LRLDKARSSHAIGNENKVKVNFSKRLQTTDKHVGSRKTITIRRDKRVYRETTSVHT
jgi:hypothetical protein